MAVLVIVVIGVAASYQLVGIVVLVVNGCQRFGISARTMPGAVTDAVIVEQFIIGSRAVHRRQAIERVVAIGVIALAGLLRKRAAHPVITVQHCHQRVIGGVLQVVLLHALQAVVAAADGTATGQGDVGGSVPLIAVEGDQ